MQTGIQLAAASVAANNFTEALPAGTSSVINNILLPRGAWGRTLIRSIEIVSKENCAWQVDWFSSSLGVTTDPDTDNWLGRWGFAQADGQQLNGAGLWRYVIPEIVEPYQDLQHANADQPQYLHLMLTNQTGSTVDKSALAAGAVKIIFVVEPMGQNN